MFNIAPLTSIKDHLRFSSTYNQDRRAIEEEKGTFRRMETALKDLFTKTDDSLVKTPIAVYLDEDGYYGELLNQRPKILWLA